MRVPFLGATGALASPELTLSARQIGTGGQG